jgi:hypothetical protein
VVDKATLGQVFSDISVSLATHHSTNFSIIIINRCWYNAPIGGRSSEWNQLDSTHHYTNLTTIKKLPYLPSAGIAQSV